MKAHIASELWDAVRRRRILAPTVVLLVSVAVESWVLVVGANLQSIVLESERLIHANLLRCTCRDLACSFVEGDRFEGRIVVVVDCLEDGLGAS